MLQGYMWGSLGYVFTIIGYILVIYRLIILVIVVGFTSGLIGVNRGYWLSVYFTLFLFWGFFFCLLLDMCRVIEWGY